MPVSQSCSPHDGSMPLTSLMLTATYNVQLFMHHSAHHIRLYTPNLTQSNAKFQQMLGTTVLQNCSSWYNQWAGRSYKKK